MSSNRNVTLDYLRAVSIMLVVLAHIGIIDFDGHIGVDLFFIISGYLVGGVIAQKILDKRISVRHFIFRRMRRIIPTLSLISLFVFILSFLFYSPRQIMLNGEGLVSSFFFVANLYFNHRIDYFSADASMNPVVHLWSLSVEEQYYIILAALFVFIKTMRHYLMILACVMIASILFVFLTVDLNTIHYSLLSRSWLLCVGSIIYFYNVKFISSFHKFASLSLFILSLFSNAHASLDSLSCVYLFTSWIGTEKDLVNRSSLFLSIVSWIGRASFTIYLVHQPIITSLKVFDISMLELSIISLLLIGFMSFVIYEFYESKIINIQYNYKNTLMLCLIHVLTLLSGAVLYLGHDKGHVIRHNFAISKIQSLRDNVIRYGDDGKPCFSNEQHTSCQIGSKYRDVPILMIGDSFMGDLSYTASIISEKTRRPIIFSALGNCSLNDADLSEVRCDDHFEKIKLLIEKYRPGVIFYAGFFYKTDNAAITTFTDFIMKMNLSEKLLVLEPRYVFNVDNAESGCEEISSIRQNVGDKFPGASILALPYTHAQCSDHSALRQLYRDPSHFSNFGVRLLEPEIYDAIIKKLPPSPL